MDDARFAAWTRRRFGLATAGLAATRSGMVGLGAASAKHKHRHRHKKKKCTTQQTRCGKRCVTGDCCPDQPCGESGLDCTCGRTSDGATFCLAPIVAVCKQCESSDDCNEPFRCVQVSDCGEAVTAICLPACGADH
jgi:hypothetical protein